MNSDERNSTLVEQQDVGPYSLQLNRVMRNWDDISPATGEPVLRETYEVLVHQGSDFKLSLTNLTLVEGQNIFQNYCSQSNIEETIVDLHCPRPDLARMTSDEAVAWMLRGHYGE